MDMTHYALKGRIIDAVSDTPIEDGLLVIEGERIAYVGAYDASKIPEGAQVLQVENGTILPGFIDCLDIFPCHLW